MLSVRVWLGVLEPSWLTDRDRNVITSEEGEASGILVDIAQPWRVMSIVYTLDTGCTMHCLDSWAKSNSQPRKVWENRESEKDHGSKVIWVLYWSSRRHHRLEVLAKISLHSHDGHSSPNPGTHLLQVPNNPNDAYPSGSQR